ncbi:MULTISPECIES: ABC transporter ATP-binding protein [unclassified Pseudonocardia]|uniref:ABC transporter ATP-binding protein n=1 Tax=unclassified Pseudonocardia TaxID=2619320 RepID=UPI00095E28B6|nr:MULTISPECIES: ABC transporter ATP-binding protein [unclassified Pseudonocardia]MBN9097482.1 ABC transporter ATP-binding protein [Pseudonocardia sp.]OJY39815.1 MAG: spermidine/putrescine ABC transporter ATP-binding protein [Pseudonocardia sp. 73-21]
MTSTDVRATAAALTTPVTGGAAVELLDLRRTFGTTRALDGLSLSLAPGELVALLGPSGCGKTTALRALAGMETVDSGQILVDGKDISGVPTRRRDMGMVFQSYSLFPNLSARDNVAFGLRVRGRSGRNERATELLDMVGLADHAAKYPHQMSGGQQQRVALARALAIEPRVLLLDEPLSALDAKVRLQLREQIRLLQTQLGTTTLFVTHDQEEALSMADRVGVMRGGQLEQIATPDELYDRPATAFVAEFVGTMNRLPAHVVSGGVRVLGRDVTPVDVGGRGVDARVDVLARPELIGVTAAEHGAGIVTGKTFLGGTTRVAVLLDGDLAVLADRPSGEAAKLGVGDAVEVAVTGTNLLLVDPTAG